jgi:hypothetical protein
MYVIATISDLTRLPVYLAEIKKNGTQSFPRFKANEVEALTYENRDEALRDAGKFRQICMVKEISNNEQRD